MHYSRYSKQTSSESSAASNHRSPAQKLKSPITSDYEYLGRLVTHERPIIRRSKSIQQNLVFPQNSHKYHHSMRSHHQDIYKEVSNSSSDEDIDDSDGLSKPLGVIRISDRHYREIYRLPTPPPKVKRVFHRLQSPEPKIIERVYVRRPPPEIIENVIEVPGEKVRIINREKYLEKSAPVTRSKLVHVKSRHHHHHQEEDEPQQQQQQQQYEQTYIPSEQYNQQQTATVLPTTTQQSPGTATTLVYPPQPNMNTVGYIKSTIPPDVMFNSQQPIQIPASQISNQQMVQPTAYDHPPQQPTTYQMVPSTTYNHPPQQPTTYQMVPSTTYNYPSQQPANYQMIQPTSFTYPPQQTINHQMVQPIPYPYTSQQAMPNSLYGYTQYQ